jgi:hypothetical protein
MLHSPYYFDTFTSVPPSMIDDRAVIRLSALRLRLHREKSSKFELVDESIDGLQTRQVPFSGIKRNACNPRKLRGTDDELIITLLWAKNINLTS